MEHVSNSFRSLHLLAVVNLDRLIWPLAVLTSLAIWGLAAGL